jgi:hypothetical protein
MRQPTRQPASASGRADRPRRPIGVHLRHDADQSLRIYRHIVLADVVAAEHESACGISTPVPVHDDLASWVTEGPDLCDSRTPGAAEDANPATG